MKQMVRKQIYIKPTQEELLKRRASELRMSEAELIRGAIDAVLTTAQQPVPSRKAWLKALETMDRLAAMDVPQQGKDWTRGELYDRWPAHHPS
ncbi:MAG: hypothetical protein M1370_08785 [Bacteroidetes bacterium]|nr:hypothetical protein [Bacteroidota bacterium]MCL5025566.1 hypothetical protein [Chloroflexota bacterium]